MTSERRAVAPDEERRINTAMMGPFAELVERAGDAGTFESDRARRRVWVLTEASSLLR
jgi:hypothetical protein